MDDGQAQSAVDRVAFGDEVFELGRVPNMAREQKPKRKNSPLQRRYFSSTGEETAKFAGLSNSCNNTISII